MNRNINLPILTIWLSSGNRLKAFFLISYILYRVGCELSYCFFVEYFWVMMADMCRVISLLMCRIIGLFWSMLFGRRKFDSLKAVVQVRRKLDREKARIVGWVKGLSDYFFVIIRAFFAGSKKAPAKMNRPTFISL